MFRQSEQLLLGTTKVFYKQADMWISAKETSEAIDKMEEAANGFTVEGPDGEEGIVLPAGFDPRKLPNASEIDYSNEKTPSEVEAMKERFE